jgi:MYXO-CTERM domain-containing protein
MGCEYSALEYGAEVAIAGFGNSSENGGAGTKRWALTHTAGVNLSANIGEAGGMGGDPAACQGDSGGPAFVRMADGGWRTWGIVSTGTSCGSAVNYSLVSGAVPWIEQNSGVDITPCFDAEGNWDATPQCQGFNASEPGAAFGSWNNGCVGGPTSPASSSCGPTWDAPPDEAPPTVSITNPVYGQVFPDDPSTLGIDIDAFDADWGIKHVRLLIDGQEVGSDNTEPYGFAGVTFPKGTYELVAVAEDHAGWVTNSTPVVIGVAEDDIPDPPADTGSGGDDDSGGVDSSGGLSEGTGTGDPGLGDAGSDEGCACDTRKGGPGGWTGLAFLALLGWRRRR